MGIPAGLGRCEARKMLYLCKWAVVQNSQQILRVLNVWKGDHAPANVGILETWSLWVFLHKKMSGGSISGLETGEISRQTRCWDSNRTGQHRWGRSDGQQIGCLLTRSLNSFLIAACVSKRFTMRREAWHGFRVHSGTFGEGAVSQHPVILSRGASFSCSDNRDSQKVTPLTEMS